MILFRFCDINTSRILSQIFQPIGGETSGFTAASTAKAMNAFSGKVLARGGHPPQEREAVITAPPQKKRTPESVTDDFPSHRGGDSERFRLTFDLF